MINQQAEFIKLKDIENRTLDIFKMGDNVKNKEFFSKMEELMRGIIDRVGHASKVFKEIIAELTKAVLGEKSGEDKSCQYRLISMIDLFLSHHNIESPDKKKLALEKSKNHAILSKSKVLELLHLITQKEYKFQNL